MNTSETITFESLSNQSKLSFLDDFNYLNPYFLGSILIGSYILIGDVPFEDNPILYGLFAIVVIHTLIFLIIHFFTKKVIKISFDLNSVTFHYRYLSGVKNKVSSIHSLTVLLYELKNHILLDLK